MKHGFYSFPIFALTALIFSALALLANDTLELRNGSTLKGVYEGGTPDVIRFNFNGATQEYSRNDVASIQLAAQAPSRPIETPPVSTTAPAPSQSISIPAGTMLVASLQQKVNSGAVQPGQTFPAILVSDVRVGNEVVLTAGTQLQGQIVNAQSAGRLRKQADLTLTINAINYQGRLIPVRTTTQQEASDNGTGREVVGGAARGAALGAIFGAITGDAGDGAAAGAAAGAAGGLIRKGDDVEYPSGAVLGFTLESPAQL